MSKRRQLERALDHYNEGKRRNVVGFVTRRSGFTGFLRYTPNPWDAEFIQ